MEIKLAEYLYLRESPILVIGSENELGWYGFYDSTRISSYGLSEFPQLPKNGSAIVSRDQQGKVDVMLFKDINYAREKWEKLVRAYKGYDYSVRKFDGLGENPHG